MKSIIFRFQHDSWLFVETRELRLELVIGTIGSFCAIGNKQLAFQLLSQVNKLFILFGNAAATSTTAFVVHWSIEHYW